MNEDRFFILNRGDLEKRLDPFYYIPSLVALEEQVLANKAVPLRSFVKKMASGATPTVAEFDKYYSNAEEGHPFIRVQNLSETGVLSLEDVKYINDFTQKVYLKRSQVEENDLVTKITGVGRMAVSSVPPIGFKGNINQHSVVIKTESRQISEYLAAYLNSDIGEKLATRRSTGGTRPALDYPALRSIPVICNEEIFNRAREARNQREKKESQIQELLASIDDYLLKELGIVLPPEPENTIENRKFRTSLSNVTGGRIDPFFHRPFYKASSEVVSEGTFPTVKLRDICYPVRGVAYSRTDEVEFESDVKILRANNIDLKTNDLVFTDVRYLRDDFMPSSLQKLYENDILVSIASGSKEHVGKVAFVEKDLNYYFGGFMSVFRMKSDSINPKFLFYFLQSRIFRRVLFKNLGGTNINNLTFSMISGIDIPFPSDDKQTEIVEFLDDIKMRCRNLQKTAINDFQQAKKEIERLILEPTDHE